jgi:hypothetical protein
LHPGNLVFTPARAVDPVTLTGRLIANLNPAAIDERRRQLVMWVRAFWTATVMDEVVDFGVTFFDQLLAGGFDDAAQMTRRDRWAAPDSGYFLGLLKRRGPQSRFDNLALQVGTVLTFVEA